MPNCTCVCHQIFCSKLTTFLSLAIRYLFLFFKCAVENSVKSKTNEQKCDNNNASKLKKTKQKKWVKTREREKKKKNYSRHVNFLSYNNILHQETSTSTTKKKRENRINVKLFKTRKLSEKIGRLRWNDKQVQVKHSN